MNVSITRTKKLAKSLLALNQDFGMSWREIAFHVYKEKVNFATLNRFANSGGTWIPKDEKILCALGLKKEHKPREWNQKRSITEAMSQMIKLALRWKKNQKVTRQHR